MAKIEHLDPTTIHKPRGWTHVVKATGGSTVYVSGQIGVTPDGTVLAGLEAQAAQAYANLRAALAAAGAAPEHVVKETIFVVDYRPEKAMALRARDRDGGMPIVVISADGTPEKVAAVGARGFLAKPFDIEALLAQVEAVTRPPEGGRADDHEGWRADDHEGSRAD